jgi:hypothetical protein
VRARARGLRLRAPHGRPRSQRRRRGRAPRGRQADLAGRAIDGAIARLEDPENLARLRRIAETAAAAAVASALSSATRPSKLTGLTPVEQAVQDAFQVARRDLVDAMLSDFGTTGTGVVNQVIAASANHAATAATDGALRRLLPACGPGDEACVDQRVSTLSHTAGLHFTKGVQRALVRAEIAGGFVAGVAFTTIAAVLLGRWRSRRATRRLARPQPA